MRIPLATYRVQFNSSYGFSVVKSIIPYLAKLGMSDIYASPIFKAKKGSPHCYDVVDPTQLNPELGSGDDFEAMIREVKHYKMGWLQDIVPNHMAYDSENEMLMDVLENGQHSHYFDFFDIDWNYSYETIKGKLLAPFLGRFYGESLEKGEIQLRYENIGFSINYYNLKFPLKIDSYLTILTYRLGRLKRKLGEEHQDFIKLGGILSALRTIPSGEKRNERSNQIKFIKGMLWELYTKNHEIERFLDYNLQLFNGQKGNPASFRLLDKLLSKQLFRLSFWKVATEEVNYRRFFNINGLISLKVEEETAFNHTHSLVFKLVDDGIITGLRIDHIDGLYDPTSYLKRVRKEVKDLYLVVEKILDFEEELPSSWPIQGTTGYDFMNYLNGIFCEGEHKGEFSKICSSFTGFKTPYEDLAWSNKRLIIGKLMAGDVDNLAHLMKGISSRDRHGSDITLYGLKRAIVEVLTFFPVYRTYINEEIFSEIDQSYLREAVKRAKQKNPGLLYEINFMERFLLLKFRDYLTEEEKKQWIYFTMRFQQFTGPLMAKGFEDTTLYVYNRLLSLNEVGGDPNRFGISIETFHRFNKKRATFWSSSLNATSTHDTKRGEDVRARINVLSEIPREWGNALKRWSKVNRRKKKTVNGMKVPDRNDEYFLYQTLIGAFPFYENEHPSFIDRIKHYILKAIREAKIHTAWLKPDTVYEDAFLAFVEDILNPSEQNQFLKEFLSFQKKVAHYGIFNSLSQTLVKITTPGVPDFYQGTELWDLNLVDPDNRRPVDFEKREKYLQEIIDKEGGNILDLILELLATKEDGRIKLFLIYRALKVRKHMTDFFQKAPYIPMEVEGRFKKHIFSFARKDRGRWVLTITPRLLSSLIKEDEYPLGIKVWDDTSVVLSEDFPLLWEDAITSQSIKGSKTLLMGEVLKHFPIALLISGERK